MRVRRRGTVPAMPDTTAPAPAPAPPALADGVHYLAMDQSVCSRVSCAGVTARATGFTIGGAQLTEVTAVDKAAWALNGLGRLHCRCGRVTA